MTDKKIPWWTPRMEKEDLPFIKQALDNNFVNEGPLTYQLQDQFVRLFNIKYALATTSGTAALFLAMKGLGIGHGDEVIVPDVTFIATANAVDLCGAKPVLVDIDPETLNIDPEKIKKFITPKTRAIVPVHVSGRSADMESICALAKEHNLFVVEDAAEALTSKHNGRYLGTFGDAGCFSFSPNKTITTGQGGLIVTNNEDLCNKIKALKSQGVPVRGIGGNDLHNTIGYNFKITDLQSGLGLGQFIHLEERAKRLKRNWEVYSEQLKDVKELRVFPSQEGEVPLWTDIVLENLKKRDELEKYLSEHNIGCRKYWYPIHSQLAYKLPDDHFPNSTKICPKSLWLSSSFTLTDEDVMAVCEEIKNFFREE